jgi:hypothetical protein
MTAVVASSFEAQDDTAIIGTQYAERESASIYSRISGVNCRLLNDMYQLKKILNCPNFREARKGDITSFDDHAGR